MLCLVLSLLLQEPEAPPPKRPSNPQDVPTLSLLASYFQVHQPAVPDGFGATLGLQAPLFEDVFLEAGARWYSGNLKGNDLDLGIATLGLAKVGGAHAVRVSASVGLALLASGDLDDDVDFGAYAAVQLNMITPESWGIVFFRYEVIVPETDAGFGGQELELIQGFSFGLTLAF